MKKVQIKRLLFILFILFSSSNILYSQWQVDLHVNSTDPYYATDLTTTDHCDEVAINVILHSNKKYNSAIDPSGFTIYYTDPNSVVQTETFVLGDLVDDWNYHFTVSGIEGDYTLTLVEDGSGNDLLPLDDVTITVNIYPQPTVAITPDPAYVGSGSNLTLTANPVGYADYTWVGHASINGSAGGVNTRTFNSGSTGSFPISCTVTDANSCTATDNLTVNVSDITASTSSTPSPATICDGFTVDMDGIPSGGSGTYTHAWSYTSAGTGTGSFDDDLSEDPVFTPDDADTYTLTYTVTDGVTAAVASDNITVTVNPDPDDTKTVTSTDYCIGAAIKGSITIESIDALTDYTLMNNTTGLPVGVAKNGAAGIDLTWSNLNADDYYITAEDQGTSCSADYALVTVIMNALPSVTPLVDDASLCSGNSTQLHANETTGVIISTYAWDNTSATLNDASLEEPTATPTNDITYTVTVTDVNGCVNSGSKAVTVIAAPPILIEDDQGGTFEICEGEDITLTGTSTSTIASWNWSTGDITPATIISPTTVLPSSVITYTLSVIDADGCTNSKIQDVTVYDQPTANAGSDVKMCDGVGVNLTATATNGDGAYNYDWSNGANTAATNVTPGNDATYTVTVTDGEGCTHSDDVFVDFVTNPTVSVAAAAGFDLAICDGESTDLEAIPAGGAGGYTYNWPHSGASSAIVTVSPPNAVLSGPPVSTNYSVTLADLNGCIASDNINVTTNSLTAITINNDGEAYCQDNGAVTMSGSPAGGDWSNISTPGFITEPGGVFDPLGKTPTLYTVRYTYTNSNTCVSTLDAIVEVLPYSTPTISIDNPADGSTFCNVGEPLVNITTTDNVGGQPNILREITSASAGIVDNTDGTGTFDPNDAGGAGIGTHTITYTVTTPGCNSSTSISVDVGNPVVITPLNDMCKGDADQVLVVDVAGGIWDITFTPTATMIPITVSYPEGHALAKLDADEPGVYEVDYNLTVAACTNTTTVTCDVHDIPVVDFEIGSFNQADGGINFCDNIVPVNLIPTPGGGSFSSTPAGNVNALTFEPAVVGAGNYTITYSLTDGNGCFNSIESNNITVNTSPVVDITGLNATYCNDAAAFTITGDPISGNAGFGTFTFPGLWVGGDEYTLPGVADGTAEIDPQQVDPTGTFNITYEVDDLNGCTGTITEPFTINQLPTVDFNGIPASGAICKNASAIDLIGSPETGDGLFSGIGVADDADGTGSFDPSTLTVGTHTITYTYTNPATFCVNSISKDIDVLSIPAQYSITAPGGVDYCEGDAGVQLGVTNSQITFDYDLIRNGTTTVASFTSVANGAFNFAGTHTNGDYTVVATDPISGCEEIFNNTVTVNEIPAIDDAGTITGDANVCADGTTVYTYSVPAITNATDYVWNLPANVSLSASAGSSVDVIFDPAYVAANIEVYGIDAGNTVCPDGNSSSIAVAPRDIPVDLGATISGDNVVCDGETGKTYSILVTDFNFETSFEWETTSGVIMTDPTASNVTIDFATGNPATISGTLRVRAVNICGTSAWVNLAIIVNPIPNVTINALGAGDVITCDPASRVTLNAATTEVGLITWLWTASAGGVIDGAINAITADASHEGTFDVQIGHTTNGLECYNTAQILVGADKDAPTVTIDPADDLTCTNLSLVTLQANAVNVTYDWTFTPPANITTATNISNPTVDEPGTYTVTVTDLTNSCTASASETVIDNTDLPDVSVTSPCEDTLTCKLTELTATLDGGSSATNKTFLWTGPDPTIIDATLEDAIVDVAGTYTLKVTDTDNGCWDTKTVLVEEDVVIPSVAIANVDAENADLTCINTEVDLEATSNVANATFVWNAGAGNISFQSGAPYNHQASVTVAATYSVVATNPSNGCSSVVEPEVVDDNLAVATTTNITSVGTELTCTNGGTLNLVAAITGDAGTGTFAWTGTGVLVPPLNVNNVDVTSAGTYTLTYGHSVTGCSTTANIVITDKTALPTVSINAGPYEVTCANLTAKKAITPTLSATGDGNALTTYLWEGPATATYSDNTALSTTVNVAGIYTITATNPYGCEWTDNVTVTPNTSVPNIYVTDPAADLITCTNITINIDGNSSTLNADFLWTGPGGSSIIDPDDEDPNINMIGVYTLVVTDPLNGCTSTLDVTVNDDIVKPSAAITNVDAENADLTCINTEVDLEATSNVANATFVWNAGAGNISSQSGTPYNHQASVTVAATYSVVATNPSNGCSSVVEPELVGDNFAVATTTAIAGGPYVLTCTNGSQVTLDGVAVETPAGVGSYNWTTVGGNIIPPTTTEDVVVDATGTYKFHYYHSVTGCETTAVVDVTEDKIPVASPTINNTETCYGTANPAFIKISGDNIKWYSDVALINQIFVGDSYTPGVTTVGMHTYYATSTGTNGCESSPAVVTLTIDTLPEPPFTTGNAICEGSAVKTISAIGHDINWYDNTSTHLVGGSTYIPAVTADGAYTYYATTTDVNGCESGQAATTYIINEVPTPPSFVNSALEVCETETNPVFTVVGDSIQWYKNIAGAVISTGNSHQPDETLPGIHTYYATQTVNSCESTEETGTLTINPMPVIYNVTGGGSYCEESGGIPVGLSNSENGVNYELWLDETSMIADVLGTLAAISFGNQTDAGNYTVYAKNTTTLCRRKMNGGVDVVVNPLPGDAGSITGSATVCQTETGVIYTIDPVLDATSYEWTVPVGFTIVSGDNSNSITVDIDNTADDGNISVYAENFSCGAGNVSPNLFVTVNPIPGDAGVISGNATICNDEDGVEYSIAAVTGATHYNWTLPQGATVVAGANSRQITLDFDNTAVDDEIKVSAANTCGEGISVSQSISVTDLPYVFAGNQQDLCDDNTILEGNTPSAGTGTWSIYSGAATISDVTNPVSALVNIGEGQTRLVWTITANACSLSDTVLITNNQVNVEAGENHTICSESVVLAGSSVPADAVGSWSVITGAANFADGNSPSTTATGFATGTNILKWSVAKSGCTNYDSLIIDNQRPTQAYAGIDQSICMDTTILDANSLTIGTGLWTVVVGAATFADDTVYNTKVTGLSKGDNILRWTISNGICNTIDEVTITNNQLYVDAGVDQVICSNTSILDAIDPPSGVGYWAVDTGSAVFVDINQYNTVVTGLAKGLNVLTWNINNNGCISTDTVSITNDFPTKADAGPDTVVEVDYATLQGNIPSVGDGVWTLISGSAAIADASVYNTNVSSLAFGDNIFRWTITNNSCISTDDVTINNNTPTNVNAGSDQSICEDWAMLDGSEPIYYGQWSVVQGTAIFANPDEPITKVTSLAKGENILRWSVWQNGWTSDDVVISNDLPTEANAGTDQVLCTDSINLSANDPIIGSGKWTIISGSGQFENDTINDTKVTNLAQGENIFKWTITNKSCSLSSQVSITNNSPTTADAGLDQTICTNTLILNPNTPSKGMGEWSIVSGAGNFNDNVVTYLAPDTNILRWTIINNACSSYDEITIVNNEPSNANAGTHKIICTDSINLAASTPIYGDGIWTIQSGSADIESNITATTKVTNLNQGINKFRWTITYNGCVKSDEVNIHNAFVEATAGIDQEICSEFTDLDANNPEAGTGTWSVLGGSGSAIFDDASINDTYVSGLDQGDNVLRWTITNEICISSDDVVITNNLPTDAFAGPDQSLCTNSSILQGNTPFKGIGVWSVLSGSANIEDSIAPNSPITDLGYGVNTLRWTITNGSCFSWDEVVISNNSTETSNAGVEQSICIDSTILYANEPAFGIGQWSVISGSATFVDNNKYNTKVKDLGKGVNILKWVISNGQCSSSSEVTVSNNSPTKAIAGADQTICGDHTFLQANTPVYGTGQWNLVSGSADFAEDTAYNTEVTDLNPGENTIRWTITNSGCESTDDVIITNDLPYESDAGNDFEICGTTTSLYANDPLTGDGEWIVISGSATFDDPYRFDADVSALGFGANTFRWTITYDACTTYDEVIVTNNKIEVYAGEDRTIGEDSTQLTASNPSTGSGEWTTGGAGIFADASNAITMVYNLSSGLNTFRWAVEINSCISYDDVSVTYDVPPEASFVITTSEGCPPLEVYFVNNSLDGLPFTWDFDDGTTSDQITVKHTYNETGVYKPSLTIIDDDGKTVEKDTTIIVFSQPEAAFLIVNQEVYIPEEEAIFINTSTDAISYQWDFGDGGTSIESDPRYVYDTEGIYDIILQVWSDNNCYDSTIIVGGVEVIESGTIIFPTAFTPNLDGSSGGAYNPLDFSNDVFYPIGEGLENYHLEIFNRWGVFVFESYDINIGWDGYYDNKLLNKGVYVWKVTGKLNNGKDFKKVGTVLLLR